MRRIISFMLAALLLLNITVFAQNSAYYSVDEQTICVEGQLLQPESFTDDWVTFILKKKNSEFTEESIGYVGQSYISEDGKYQHKFEFDKNIHDYELYVRAGAEDVTDSVVKATSLSGKIMKCSVQLQNGSCKVTGYLGELINEQQFLVIVAFYNNDRLVSVDVREDIYIDEEGSFEISVDAPNNAQTAKAFIWETLESMVPLGTTSQIIDFGYELEEQEKTGYAPLTGENNYQQYLQARAELPEEVPVIYPFSVNAGTEFYVSPDGNDRNKGTIDAPFKTIQKALSEVACLSDAKKTNSVAIYLREGNYLLSKPLELSEGHCDMINNSTLFISSYNNEKVRITNGMTFKGSQFELVTEDNTDAQTLARMNENALGKVYVADYDDLGISKMVGFDANNSGVNNAMYQNEHKLTLARYPNIGYDYVEEVLVDGLNDETLAVWIPEDKQVFTWKDTGKIGIYGMTCAPWITHSGLPTINADEGTLAIRNFSIYQPTGFENRPFSIYCNVSKTIKSHYYYYNIFEELDVPSEWMGDDETGKLYFYPVDGELKDDDEIRIGVNDPGCLVAVNNASNIIFNGLTFENSLMGIQITSSSDIVIQNCEVNANNGWAVFMTDTNKCGVINSKISHSRSGVAVQTSETKKEFKPFRNFVQNCHLSFIENTCVEINSPGNIVSHNLIENYEGFGVILMHSENIIEYNDIRMGQLQGDEGGGIYTGGGYAYRNNHIRYNYLHDFRPPLISQHGWLLSSDNCSESQYYYGNISEKGYNGAGSNSGDQNIFDGNIIIDPLTTAVTNGSFFYDMNNLGPHVLNAGMESGFFTKYNDIGAYTSEEWNTRYPNLKARTDWIMQLSEEWDGGAGSAESDDMIFFRSDTGCYYINNIIVGGGDVGPSEVGRNYLVENLNLKDNPYADVPQHNGESYRDYNVIDNNIELDDFDITSVDYFSNIGMLTTVDSGYDYKNSEIYVLTAEGFTETDTYGFDLAWLGRDDGNYYRVTVASDSDFTEIVSTVDTKPNETFCSIELPSEGTYYYKIELFSLDDSLSGDAVACSKPCQISIN